MIRNQDEKMCSHAGAPADTINHLDAISGRIERSYRFTHSIHVYRIVYGLSYGFTNQDSSGGGWGGVETRGVPRSIDLRTHARISDLSQSEFLPQKPPSFGVCISRGKHERLITIQNEQSLSFVSMYHGVFRLRLSSNYHEMICCSVNPMVFGPELQSQ